MTSGMAADRLVTSGMAVVGLVTCGMAVDLLVTSGTAVNRLVTTFGNLSVSDETFLDSQNEDNFQRSRIRTIIFSDTIDQN